MQMTEQRAEPASTILVDQHKCDRNRVQHIEPPAVKAVGGHKVECQCRQCTTVQRRTLDPAVARRQKPQVQRQASQSASAVTRRGISIS